MSQIRFSKHLFSHKNRRIIIFSSKLRFCSTPKSNPPLNSPKKMNNIFTTNPRTNPNPTLNLMKKTSSKVDILMGFQNQEEECIHKSLQSLTPSHLLQVLEVAALFHPFILHTILSLLDYNPSLRPKTTSEILDRFFSKYGDAGEGGKVLIFDQAGTTRESKVRDFVSFKNGRAGPCVGPGFREKASSILGPLP